MLAAISSSHRQHQDQYVQVSLFYDLLPEDIGGAALDGPTTHSHVRSFVRSTNRRGIHSPLATTTFMGSHI